MFSLCTGGASHLGWMASPDPYSLLPKKWLMDILTLPQLGWGHQNGRAIEPQGGQTGGRTLFAPPIPTTCDPNPQEPFAILLKAQLGTNGG